MKKNVLLVACALVTTAVFADLPRRDISTLLSQNPALTLGLEIPGEPGIKGCVGDFNNDGTDDFILTGLYNEGDVQKGFFRVYLGQESGIPVLALDNTDFPIAGNGAIDCVRLGNGSWLVALQGGTAGNWTNPFKGQVFSLSVDGTAVNFELVSELSSGAGRGSLLFLDMNGDGHADIFQNGWNAEGVWTNIANNYINDGEDSWFDLETNADVRPAANTFTVKGDLNNDGRIDLVEVIQGTGLYAYLNNGDGSFTEKLVMEFVIGTEPDYQLQLNGEDDATQVELIDFDNDGLKDIVLAGVSKHATPWIFLLKMFKNNGDGTFTEIAQQDKAGSAVTFLGGQRGDFAVADFDCDGNMDFILGVENQSADTWGARSYYFSGNGQGGFDQSEITYNETDYPTGIVPMCRRGNFGRFMTGDFDGNGTVDLITAGTDYYAKSPGLRIYYNTTVPAGINDNTVSSSVSVYSSNSDLFVNHAAGAELSIYTLAGSEVYQAVIAGEQASVRTGLTPGIYVVKVKDHVQKVVIR